jgi:hypothetical protein
VRDFLALARPYLADPPRYEEVRQHYDVSFERAIPQSAEPVGEADYWKEADIGTPEHAGGLEKVPSAEIEDAKGSVDKLVIYQHRAGGRSRVIPLKGQTGDVSKWKAARGYEVTSATWNMPGAQTANTGVVGRIVADVLKKGKVAKGVEQLEIDLLAMPGVDYGGYIDPASITKKRASLLQAAGYSPIELQELELDLDKGLVGRGVIPTPTIKLLEKVQIAVVVDGGDVGLEASIAGSDLKLPGPFKVTGGAMQLTVTASGASVSGQVDFAIDKLAKGHIGAAKGTTEAFELEGALDFESEMFSEAHLGLSYRDGHLGVQGRLAAAEGKIAGIRKAFVEVSVQDERVAASGKFTPSLRGFEEGEIGFSYDPAKGAEMTGRLQLSQGIPGLRGGTLEGRIAERATGGYSLAGDITVQPSIPGVTAEIHGHYEDGAFLAEADLAYRRGMLDGSVHLGVTNQAPGADGRPAGPPTDHLTAFGGGEVTIRVAPWLQGQIGLQLQPNGEMVVTGEVGLPDHLDVFPEKSVDKSIFKIGVDIPIVGVSIAGQNIGIFATIRGGLDASAGFGPGQLRDLALKVTYNPDREADTRIEGSAAFHVPAHAGLKLYVQGALGAGIPVVDARAGLEVSGELGLAGAADASTNVSWSPGRGLVLDARGDIFVEPKFRFAITGFVEVTADLWIDTIDLYSKRWELAAFEYGSNLRFGVGFPIHYEEGKPFDIALDQVQFTYPNIDAGELLSGLVEHIA